MATELAESDHRLHCGPKAILDWSIAMEARIYDVVVVGGGAAGLSAALVLGRARRRMAVVDAGAPCNAPAAHMQGFLSRDGMPRRTCYPSDEPR
jgi:cation diffusion facilitator CzcD-associated flavoprotein CzcO